MSPRLIAPLLVLALAACQAQIASDDDMTPMDVAKPIQVERVRVQYSASFPTGASELSHAEALRLETFLDQAGVRPSDSVFISAAPGDPLAAARVARVGALLDHRSIGMVPLAAPRSGVAADHVLIQADRYVATPPRCPDWSGSPATGHTNVPSSNFGCATATNLAEMVANPRDIMMGRDLAPADAEPGLNAVSRYRTDQVKPFLAGGGQGEQSGSGQAASGAPAAGAPAAAASAAAPSQ